MVKLIDCWKTKLQLFKHFKKHPKTVASLSLLYYPPPPTLPNTLPSIFISFCNICLKCSLPFFLDIFCSKRFYFIRFSSKARTFFRSVLLLGMYFIWGRLLRADLWNVCKNFSVFLKGAYKTKCMTVGSK